MGVGEAIYEIIKIFLEKYFVRTVISFVGGTAIYLLTPKNSCIADRITEMEFWAFLCACIFVITEIIIFLKEQIELYKHNKCIVDEAKKVEKDKHREKMENLWSFVEGLNQNERKILIRFLKNKNEPIDFFFTESGNLFSSNYICKQICYDGGTRYTKCVLKESFFQDLTESYELYGRISHFKGC